MTSIVRMLTIYTTSVSFLSSEVNMLALDDIYNDRVGGDCCILSFKLVRCYACVNNSFANVSHDYSQLVHIASVFNNNNKLHLLPVDILSGVDVECLLRNPLVINKNTLHHHYATIDPLSNE